MKKTYSITVGIPAYNEGTNIKKLVTTVLSQKEVGYKLDKVIVVSDGSSDNTVSEVKIIKDKRVKILKNEERQGLSLTQDRILENTKSEIVILLNGDVMIKDKKFITKLLRPFRQYYKVGIVSPEITPLKGKNFFEKVINFSIGYKYAMYKSLQNGNNLYMCHGRARAFHRTFYKGFRWNKKINEDSYSYLKAVHQKFSFVFQPEAEVFYRSPNNYKDHYRQSNRFMSSKKELSIYFPAGFLEEQFHIDLITLLRFSIQYFFKNPVYFICFVAILFYTKTHSNYRVSTKWDVALSTKALTYE
jgi:glycosyltransferase involved in cell wall biosynthesis